MGALVITAVLLTSLTIVALYMNRPRSRDLKEVYRRDAAMEAMRKWGGRGY